MRALTWGYVSVLVVAFGLPGATEGSCIPSGTQLCLAGSRFQVSATFTTPSGMSGSAQAIALTDDTGYFWFFSSSNVEMVVKVLDACSLGGHYWVFAGGLTDVQVDMKVEDTRSGIVKTYSNPQGRAFQPIQDTAAFATCGAAPRNRPRAARAAQLRTAMELNQLLGGEVPARRWSSPRGAATGPALHHGSQAAALPILSETFALTAPDASTGDWFGIRTKIFNDLVAVGAWWRDDAAPTDINCNSGAVYLFRRDQGGPNHWGLVKKLLASDLQCNAYFGYSLDFAGDTLAVGAYATNDLKGAAYVFQRNFGGPDNWGEMAKLAEPGQGYLQFGTSVALDHDDLVVGAPGDAYLCPDKPNFCLAGSVYFFHRSSSADPAWVLTNLVRLSGATSQDLFGLSIAASDGTVVVGAPGVNGLDGLGFVYKRQSTSLDSWGLVTTIKPSRATKPDGSSSAGEFGRWPDVLALQGDLLVGGSPTDSRFCEGDSFFCGSVHLFSRGAGDTAAWAETEVLSPPAPVTGINFGGSVGLSGDLLAVFNGAGSGSADVFRQTAPSQWMLESVLVASDQPSSGEAVSAYSGLIAVGAPTSERTCPGQRCDAGAAYLFDYSIAQHRCDPDDFSLCLAQNRFRVTTGYLTRDAAGPGEGTSLTNDTGYFWFFNSANVELLVKVLDGCALNGHFWVFAGGLTNVSVEIGVTDTMTGERKLYRSPLNSAFAPLQDTVAFACQ
jgi:hypothetical protein